MSSSNTRRSQAASPSRIRAGTSPKARHAASSAKLGSRSPALAEERVYLALIRKDRDSDFGVDFPDFPGCVTAGRTLDEAMRLAPQALALHVRGMLEDGEEIPAPSSLDAVLADPTSVRGIPVLVRIGQGAPPRRQRRTG